MSRMNDAMIDFCELSVSMFSRLPNRHAAEFELTMNRLQGVLGVEAARIEEAAFYKFLKTKRIVERIKAATGERRLRWATKLWNVIDCMPGELQPETFWALMERELADCYCNNAGPNGLKFTY